jgi:hypothetical protein
LSKHNQDDSRLEQANNCADAQSGRSGLASFAETGGTHDHA